MTGRDSELAVAQAAIAAAAEDAMARYARFTPVAEAPADIVTEADLAAQAIVVERLRAAFPADPILSEHLPPPMLGAARLWVLDPIDGTRGFARKDGEFSLLLALVEAGAPVLAVVAEPAVARTTWAARGAGCWTRTAGAAPQRCAVSARAEPCVVTLSRSQGDAGRARLLAAVGAAEAIATWSAGVKLALVARGEADLWAGDYRGLHDWDVCAGHLLVDEAGGRVSTLDGAPVRYDGSGASLRGRGIVASNGRVHDAALRALAAAGLPDR